MKKLLPKDFEEAVRQYDGDRIRAAWQLLTFEVGQAIGHNVARNEKTDELAIVVDHPKKEFARIWSMYQWGNPIDIPDRNQIDRFLNQTVYKYNIPEADRPIVNGAFVLRRFMLQREPVY